MTHAPRERRVTATTSRREVTMNDEQADRLIELVERMADRLDDIALQARHDRVEHRGLR